MSLLHIKEVVGAIAVNYGYSFAESADEYIPQELCTMPVLWLAPSKLLQIEGRSHGRMTHQIKIHLLDHASGLSTNQRCRRQELFEEKIIDMFRDISMDHRVVAIEELVIGPAQQRFTNAAELAYTASAKVITYF